MILSLIILAVRVHANVDVNCSFKTTELWYLKNCHTDVMESQGWSGGYCLATMASAGWVRAGALNSVVSDVTHLRFKDSKFPLLTGTSSGGSMFGSRFFILGKRFSSTRILWSYPCYLLADVFSSVCYFHVSFGRIAEACHSEQFDMTSTAASMALARRTPRKHPEDTPFLVIPRT